MCQTYKCGDVCLFFNLDLVYLDLFSLNLLLINLDSA